METRLFELKKRIKAIEADRNLLLNVPKHMHKPHQYVKDIKNDLLIDAHEYDGHLNVKRNRIDIRVSKKSINRALRLINSIIILFEVRGHKISVGHSYTTANIFDQVIPIRLFEKRQIVETDNKWGSRQYLPTGNLSFQFGESWRIQEINDGKLPLEDKLSTILAKVELWASEELEQKKKRAEQQKLYEEQKLIEKRLFDQKNSELSRLFELIRKSQRWKTSLVIRAYIKAIENDPSEGMESWFQWAADKADWYDPLVERIDDILTNDDRDKIDELLNLTSDSNLRM